MNIKPVLVHSHSTLDLDARMDQFLLLPRLIEPNLPQSEATPAVVPATSLVVGYDGSANSQAALDLAFCVAHQTQLSTQQPVMIHVVYVVTCDASVQSTQIRRAKRTTSKVKSKARRSSGKSGKAMIKGHESTILPQAETARCNLEEIDRVLWQARCLAEEWRGSFTTHLRFGNLADELEKFAIEENAALLFLGCHSANHFLVQQLKGKIPCSVIGIPQFSPIKCPV